MKEVSLNKGLVALVDDADFALVSPYRWHAHRCPNRVYARATVGGRLVLMHRLIVGAAAAVDIDHADHDGLNNQRFNLRQATRSQNMANARLYSTNRSGYRGVRQRGNRWSAEIVVLRKHIQLGSFATSEEAARAYDVAARAAFGEFAKCNVPALPPSALDRRAA